MNVKIYKVASMEITDLKLIDRVAQTKKPIILSTGLSSLKEIKRAIKVINKYHQKIILLHCVSGYPTKIEDANINRISLLKKEFNKYLIGLSDHTQDIASSLSAAANNIVAIEKHYKLGNINSVDSKFSINQQDLSNLRKLSERVFLSLNKKKKINKSELENKFLRRSIYIIKDLKKGERIAKNNIDTLRPKIGICASKYFEVLGRKIKKDLTKNTPLKWKFII
tara:strand:- start:448 stop:1119 length:672 start_codon:yes stop_codon:yes gene_type:complete